MITSGLSLEIISTGVFPSLNFLSVFSTQIASKVSFISFLVDSFFVDFWLGECFIPSFSVELLLMRVLDKLLNLLLTVSKNELIALKTR